MNVNLDKKAFKAHARAQHNALKERGIKLKLSDVQESLALAYGYANLATLYGALGKSEDSVVDGAMYLAQKDNLFVLSWFYDEDSNNYDEELGVYPPGTTLADISSKSFEKVSALRDSGSIFDSDLHFKLSAETVALETFCFVPCTNKYGIPDIAHEKLATRAIREDYGYRVPKTGVEASFYDTGDDSAEIVNILIWVCDEDAKIIRSMFS